MSVCVCVCVCVYVCVCTMRLDTLPLTTPVGTLECVPFESHPVLLVFHVCISLHHVSLSVVHVYKPPHFDLLEPCKTKNLGDGVLGTQMCTIMLLLFLSST